MGTDLYRTSRIARRTNTNARVRDALVAVAIHPGKAGDQLAGMTAQELETTLQAGEAQGLGTSLVTSLRSATLPVPPWLETHRFEAASRRARLNHTLSVIAPFLTEAGIPWVVLKGPVTAAAFESAGQREFADLDILVPGHRLRDGVDTLRHAGFDAINRNWGAYLQHKVAEFPVLMSGTAIDVHWHLIGLEVTRRRFAIPIDEMLERRRPASLEGVECDRLDAEDNAIHLALHAGLSGAFRIGWLRDVDRTLRADHLEWQTFVSRCLRYGVGPMVGHVLDRCRSIMATPVPIEVPERLAPRSTLKARRWLDTRRPPQRAAPRASFSGFPIATARSGAANTLGRSRELLWERFLAARGRGPRWSAYDPGGPLYWNHPSGGPNGLDRYLEFVARAG